MTKKKALLTDVGGPPATPGLSAPPILPQTGTRGRPPGQARGRGRGVGTGPPSAPNRPRGRPPGSGRGRGQGNPIRPEKSVAQAAPAAVPNIIANAAVDGPGEGTVEDHAVRPRRASGKYNPGESIIDNAPRRTSEAVQLAKQEAHKKAADTEATAKALKRDQQRRVAEFEDQMRREDVATLERSHRPDLYDVEVLNDVSENIYKDTGSTMGDNDENDYEDTHVHDSNYSDSGELADSLSDGEQQRQLELLELEKVLATSETGDPPIGIIDDEDSSNFWRARPKRVVGDLDQPEQATGNNRTPAASSTHDGEKTSAVAKRLVQAPPIAVAAAPLPVPRPATKTKPVRGDFRREVNLLREVPDTGPGRANPTNAAAKRKAQVEPAAKTVSLNADVQNAKRPKIDAPSGLVPGWRVKMKKNAPATPVDSPAEDDEENAQGEFDEEDTPSALAAARAAKTASVKIRASANAVTLKECSVMELDGSTNRIRRKKATVAQLPLPTQPVYITRWQKQFRQTLIEWAAAQKDPFGTNSLLTKDIVLSIWDKVFPEVCIGGVENDQATNLSVLISLCGDILLDWRTSIGSTAVTMLQTFFEVNDFTTEDIAEYVRAFYVPEQRRFDFIYADPEAPAGSKGGLRSQFVLDMLTTHMKKTSLTVAWFGQPIGGMGLCVAAIERAFKLWASGVNPLSKKVQTIVPGITKPRAVTQFREENGWGKRAREWVQLAQRLSDEEWDFIIGEVNESINGGGAATGSDDGDEMQADIEDDSINCSRGMIEL